MAENSGISWTHHTFNPWRGCTKVSAGCANCYAETLSGRNPGVLGVWGPKGTRVVASEAAWKEPLKWDKAAKAKGERHRVFCASLADVFEAEDTMPAEAWGVVHEARLRLFALIGRTPHLDWLLLTKRPQSIHDILRRCVRFVVCPHEAGSLFAERWLNVQPPANVWLGTSVENQQAADERIPHLLKVPAAVRFLSCEPLLGPVDLRRYVRNTFTRWPRARGVDWVIAGGESGRGARPMLPTWAQSLRDQCVAAGVPFHFKQWGEFLRVHPKEIEPEKPLLAVDGDGQPCDMSASGSFVLQRLGVMTAGRKLDGREWDEFPEVPS